MHQSSLFLCVYLSLSVCDSHSHTHSLSLSLYVCVCVCVCVCVVWCLCVCVWLCVCVCVCVCLCVSVCLAHSSRGAFITLNTSARSQLSNQCYYCASKTQIMRQNHHSGWSLGRQQF